MSGRERLRLTVLAVVEALPADERRRLTPAEAAVRHRWSEESVRRTLALAAQVGLVGQRRNRAGKMAYWRA
jgi:hypothetical protein